MLAYSTRQYFLLFLQVKMLKIKVLIVKKNNNKNNCFVFLSDPGFMDLF